MKSNVWNILTHQINNLFVDLLYICYFNEEFLFCNRQMCFVFRSVKCVWCGSIYILFHKDTKNCVYFPGFTSFKNMQNTFQYYTVKIKGYTKFRLGFFSLPHWRNPSETHQFSEELRVVYQVPWGTLYSSMVWYHFGCSKAPFLTIPGSLRNFSLFGGLMLIIATAATTTTTKPKDFNTKSNLIWV